MFRKLVIRNSWGNLTYLIGRERLDPRKEYKVMIRWPDSSEELQTLKWCNYTGTYEDMGRVYPFQTFMVFLSLPYRGIDITYPLKSETDVKGMLFEILE